MIENNLHCDDPHKAETFNNPKILILGHGRHGKDTAAAYIADSLDLRVISSSFAALDVIHPVLSMVSKYKSKLALFNTRHENRELWKELITLYNTPDKTALSKLILAKSDIYVGMRCRLEYEASKELFDYVIWVDASDRAPQDESMDIYFNPESMILLDNNGTLDDLNTNVTALLEKVNWG